MKGKFDKFALAHPCWTVVFISILLTPIVMIFGAMLTTCIVPDRSSNLEDVKNAQYVLYTSEGEMKAVDTETIVDMDTGYQYRIFEIDGQYVCAPAIDKDGTVYKTVE